MIVNTNYLELISFDCEADYFRSCFPRILLLSELSKLGFLIIQHLIKTKSTFSKSFNLKKLDNVQLFISVFINSLGIGNTKTIIIKIHQNG